MKGMTSIIGQRGGRIALLLLLLCAPARLAMAQTSSIVTEQNLKDAIVVRKTFTPAEMQQLDVNRDGGVNVADLIYVLKNGTQPPAATFSLVGEHLGVFFRDRAPLFLGQNGISGELAFALRITSLTPLTGKVESLYFPGAAVPVTFTQNSETGMNFEITFETLAASVSPQNPLTHKMAFTGTFDAKNKHILAGTYQETITGLQDVRGNQPLSLKGYFILVFVTLAQPEHQ